MITGTISVVLLVLTHVHEIIEFFFTELAPAESKIYTIFLFLLSKPTTHMFRENGARQALHAMTIGSCMTN
jgi:hypothetical protein